MLIEIQTRGIYFLMADTDLARKKNIIMFFLGDRRRRASHHIIIIGSAATGVLLSSSRGNAWIVPYVGLSTNETSGQRSGNLGGTPAATVLDALSEDL